MALVKDVQRLNVWRWGRSAEEALAADAPSLIALADWYYEQSAGRVRLDLRSWTAPSIPTALQLALAGDPTEARAAIFAQQSSLPPDDRRRDAPLLILAPSSARPHAWTLPDGQRYAVTPETAGLAVAAHEVGHLLFGWPDVPLPMGSGVRCLMGRAPAKGGPPSPPCAPLRVAAGWQTAQPLRAGAALQPGEAYRWLDWTIERQPDRIAVFHRSGPDHRPSIRLAFELPSDADTAMVLRGLSARCQR
jgi:hypothetical protein